MAGIVTSNKTRKLVGNRLKEIDVPTTTLNTALFYADLTAQGAAFTAARVNADLRSEERRVGKEGRGGGWGCRWRGGRRRKGGEGGGGGEGRDRRIGHQRGG